jgi:hypothetical protein
MSEFTTIGSAPVRPDISDGSGINSPELSTKTLKPKKRAISDVEHVFILIGNLEQSRREQNAKNGRIQAKRNSERPYSDAELKAEGLGYKSNFSTKPLSTTISKVASRLTKAIQAARYLTSSELPDSVPDAKKKTELFRRSFTNLVRKWPGWYNFINQVADEDSTFGWASNVWLDTQSWKPVFFRQDRAFFPDGTGQSVDTVQVGVFKQYLLPHELAEFIQTRDAAETAGWDVDNVVESINNAKPTPLSGNSGTPQSESRRYEDAIRESSVSYSMVSGAKQIELWHLFATEIDGKVSHYIADAASRKLLFEKLDQYKSVDDCIALFSYEQSQTLMGSKGIGREIYEMANVLDRARNEVVDRLQLSGKVWLTSDENKVNRVRLTVVGNAVVVPRGYEPLANVKVEAGVTEFLALNDLLTQLLDQIAGGVSPRPYRDAERVTKAEIDLLASREEEKRDDITTRFVCQAGSMLSTMQRRAYSSDTSDEDAKTEREKLLQYMSEEELKELAEQPALKTIDDYTQMEAQKYVLFAQEKRNDPLYDHRKLERKSASVLFDAEFAEDVLLPENDPTVAAEQARQQLSEDLLLVVGTDVPVSPRDNHLIHIEVLKREFVVVVQAAAGGDARALETCTVWLKHWERHLQAAMLGADKEALKPLVEELKATAKQIGELQGEAEAKAQQAQAVQQQLQGQLPPQAQAAAGQPPAADVPLAAAPSPELAPAPVAPTG